MKSPISSLIAVAFCVFTFATYIWAGEAPDRKTLQEDEKRLDALQRLFEETKDSPSGQEFFRASKRLADERGPNIIHAIMERATAWQDMDDLVFVPLVALLPREPTLKLLHQYQHSKRDSDRRWAGEFLTMQWTKDGVRKCVQRTRHDA